MPGYEFGAGRLLYDDIDDVVAVKIARMSQKSLFAIVVVLFEENEFRIVESLRIQRRRLGERPAGKGASAILNIVFCVIANAHREEF